MDTRQGFQARTAEAEAKLTETLATVASAVDGQWCNPALLELLKGAAELRANKLTHGEYETEATWSTRKYMPFVMQRISVAVQLAAASEIRLAMGVGQATAVA